MKIKLLFLLIVFSVSVYAQRTKRTEIQGRIIANANDVENVNIFNTSSNTGTVTDSNGEFTVNVFLNDVLEISAIQFKEIKVKITKDIISSKKLTVFLVEQINKLDEVLILPYGLSGSLTVDVKSIETFNPDLDAIYFGVNDISSYEFPDDHRSGVENTVMNENEFINGVNFVAIFGMVANNLFKKNNSNKSTVIESKQNGVATDLTDVYAQAFLVSTLDIPENQIEAFIAYVQDENFNYNLLNSGKEMQLLEYLISKSKVFISTAIEKD